MSEYSGLIGHKIVSSPNRIIPFSTVDDPLSSTLDCILPYILNTKVHPTMSETTISAAFKEPLQKAIDQYLRQ